MQKLFVSRHGQQRQGQLTPEGKQDAHTIADTLGRLGYTANSGIILCSTAERAVATGMIVQGDLQVPTLVSNRFILKAGYDPKPVLDLRDFVGNILTTEGVQHDGSDVLVVAHLPLVAAVGGLGEEDEPPPGAVYPVPEGWQNPTYDSVYGYFAARPQYWAPHAG